jgi:ATP-binding cassette subfamily B protein
MQDRTTIIISHRVSSAKLANKIVVLNDGAMVEEGTHEELLSRDGFYKDLYDKQGQLDEAEANSDLKET